MREAIDDGRIRVLRDWIATTDDVDARDTKGRTALMLAATRGHSIMVQMIIHAGADLEAKQHLGTTALMLASFTGNARIVMQVCAYEVLRCPPSSSLAHPYPRGRVRPQLLMANADPRTRDNRCLVAGNYASLKVSLGVPD